MSDLKKILDHPEKQNIISKLVSGDSPSSVSTYLKNKYNNSDQAHLRLSTQLLQEFLSKYADQHQYVQKIVAKDADSKLDKQIAESLLANKTWKKRLEDVANNHIDFKEKMVNLFTILEARTEQLFDLIQANPESTKTDYIFTKYIELFQMMIQNGDKLLNDKPDIEIKHTYSVQMVEQQSVAFQEAIRRVLERLSPDLAGQFMDMLKEEMDRLNPKQLEYAVQKRQPNLEKSLNFVNVALEKADQMEQLPDDETEVLDDEL